MKDTLIVFDCNNEKETTARYYEQLSKENKEAVDKFENYCLISANVGRAKKSKSNAIRFLLMSGKDISNINLADLQNFLRVLKESSFSDYYKNDVKCFVSRFLKYNFRDWSARFNDFEDIKYNSAAQRQKAINPEDVLSKAEVEKLIKAEPSIYWKTFLIVQYEGALRTLETRTLRWDMLDMEDTEVYWLAVISKKNKQGTPKERIAPPLSQAIYFLNELKKAQVKKSLFIFPSNRNENIPVSSGTANKWFSRLTKKVLGKSRTNYILRHSQGEEMHKAIRTGSLTEENALEMMGHSKKMFDKTYSHANKKGLKELLKKQMLNISYIAPEKKAELKQEVEQVRADVNTIIKVLLTLKPENLGALQVQIKERFG